MKHAGNAWPLTLQATQSFIERNDLLGFFLLGPSGALSLRTRCVHRATRLKRRAVRLNPLLSSKLLHLSPPRGGLLVPTPVVRDVVEEFEDPYRPFQLQALFLEARIACCLLQPGEAA